MEFWSFDLRSRSRSRSKINHFWSFDLRSRSRSRSTDRQIDRSTDRSIDRTNDRPIDRPIDRSTQPAGGNPNSCLPVKITCLALTEKDLKNPDYIFWESPNGVLKVLGWKFLALKNAAALLSLHSKKHGSWSISIVAFLSRLAEFPGCVLMDFYIRTYLSK